MAEKYDLINPSALIQNERTRSPNRRVTFERIIDPMYKPRPLSPGYDRRQEGSYAYQAKSNFGGRPMPMPRKKGRGRSIGARPFGRGARNRQSFNPQWQDNFNGQQFGPQYPFTGGQPANPRCQKCGGGRYANVLLCPANNKKCMSCGRFGQFAKVCRQFRIQQPLRGHKAPGLAGRSGNAYTMSVNESHQYMVFKAKGRIVQSLVDSGSPKSLMSQRLARHVNLKIYSIGKQGSLVSACEQAYKLLGKSAFFVILTD